MLSDNDGVMIMDDNGKGAMIYDGVMIDNGWRVMGQ